MRYLLVFTVFAAATIGWTVGSGAGQEAAPPSRPLAVGLILATIILASSNRVLVRNASHMRRQQTVKFGHARRRPGLIRIPTALRWALPCITA